MKKLSKIGLLILSLALICAGIVVSVSGAEAGNNTVSYTDAEGNLLEGTLADAVAEAADGTTITLLGNCVIEDKITIEGKSLTLDIGGYLVEAMDIGAFELGADTALSIVGSGRILLDGTIATSVAQNVTFSIEGTAGTKGIDIDHTGLANNRIVLTNHGTWLFKNIDVVSTANGLNSQAFFEMKNDSSTTADFTFDMVSVKYATPFVSSPGQYITNVAGTGHISVLKSSFVTEHSGILSGAAVNVNENEEILESILIEDSLISCSTNNTSVEIKNGERADGKTPSAKNYIIYGYDPNKAVSAKHIVNVRNSHIETDYRAFAYEILDGKGGKLGDSVANFYDSTIKVIGMNGNDSSEMFSRAMMVNTYGNTAIILPKDLDVMGNAGAHQPSFTATAGTRINIVGLTTNTGVKKAINVFGKFSTKDESGNVIKTEEKLGIACQSDDFVWVYDPVGNPDAPYVLVDKTKTDITQYADDHKFVGFETYRFTNIELDTYNPEDYVIWNNGKTSNWTSYEPFGDTPGTMNTGTTANAKMKGMQWAPRGGTFYIAGHQENQNAYLKFWTGESETGNVTLPGDSAPYWIMGERNATDSTQYDKYIRTRVFGEKRKAVIVVDFDFGSDNGIYPNFDLKFTSRSQSTGSDGKISYENNVQPKNNWLSVRDGGKTVTSALTTTGTDLEKVPEFKLNGANEWNHLSVVFYTDPNYAGGLAYVYLNGELMGTQTFYTGNADTTYLQGVRFEVPRAQVSNGSLCFDNISLRSYTNYKVTGEADGAAKSPASYIIANAPGKYINKTMSVIGNSYRGADEATLSKKATELNTVVRLQKDFNGTIKDNMLIFSNGYEMNASEDSYASNVVYDNATGSELYNFNEKFNSLLVNYYWYVGERGNLAHIQDDSKYLKTQVALGQVPEYSGPAVENVKDVENFILMVHCGWHSAGDDFTVDNLTPITFSMAIAQGDAPVYMYPSYIAMEPTAYIRDDASGSIVGMAAGDLEASKLLKTLAPGQTYVVCEDFQIDDNEVNATFSADKATYGGGVTTSNSTDQKHIAYTDEQLAAMKAASAKMALDLNGHTISIGHAKRRGSLVFVNSNVTFSVYSSKPGGTVNSIQGTTSEQKIMGLRIFGIHNGTDETAAKSYDTTNAHLVIGTVEVNGEVIPGSNLTLRGCVLVEAVVGDASCSVEVDGIRAERVSNDSAGAFMTRWYSGTYSIKNTTVVAPEVDSVISVISKSNMLPRMTVEDTVIINNGGDIIAENGYKNNSAAALTLKNVITNGNIGCTSYKGTGGRVVIDSGVIAKAVNPKNLALLVYAEGVSKAKYNNAMTLEGITDADTLEAIIPAEVEKEVIDYNNKTVVIVKQGDEYLAPTGQKIQLFVLPTLAEGTGYSSEIFSVSFKKLDGTMVSENILKGGIPTAPEVSDYELSEFITLKYLGEFDRDIVEVQGPLVYTPKYEVITKVTGIKANVSFYTSFDINIYVPEEYKNYFKRANANGVTVGALNFKDVTLEGENYVMCSIPVTPDKFAESIKFVLEFDALTEVMGETKVITGSLEIESSVISYAETILSDAAEKYTENDKKLVYAALNYANEVIKYTITEANEAVDSLVNQYKQYATESTENDYANVCDTANLKAAFLKATVKLNSAPAIVFTMQRDFKGIVTITVGGEVREFMVSNNSQRTIVLDGLTIDAITSDIVISAQGNVGSNGVSIVDATYNLATYVKYHLENGRYGDDVIPTSSQLASRKAVAVIDAMYAYAGAAEAYAAE